MNRVRNFTALVEYTNADGKRSTEEFPVQAHDNAMASSIAFYYVLHVLRLEDFELRVLGA